MTVYYLTVFATTIVSLLAEIAWQKERRGVGEERNRPRYKGFFVFLTSAILSVVSGFRWMVGTDYRRYSVNYYRYAESMWEDLISWSEPGIRIIAKIASWVHDDYVTMFVIAAGITVVLSIGTIARHTTMFAFSVMLYIFVGAWHGSFNGVRQYLACAILLAGHKYIIEKRLLKYVAVVLVASLFHVSALGMTLLYFVPLRRLRMRELAILVVLTSVAFYSYNIIFDIIETFKGRDLSIYSYSMREVNPIRVAVSLAPLLLYYIPQRTSLTSKDMFYVNMLFVNAAVSFATLNSAYLARFVLYTNIYITLGLPRLVNFPNRYLRVILKSSIVALYALFWYIDVSGSIALRQFRWVFERS